MKHSLQKHKTWILLWLTQSLSHLFSTVTAFALTLYLYQETGSALQTALLSICSYAPYVIMSIFAGALSDRWNKKRTMLVCDTLAAMSTLAVYLFWKSGTLTPVHLYVLNALNGLMNTVQQPASSVAMTMITPKEAYQKSSGLRSLSGSLVTILHPVLATTLYACGGMQTVVACDLGSFAIAFLVLLFWIPIPEIEHANAEQRPSVLVSAREGLTFLTDHPKLWNLILFFAGINLVASAFDATLPAYILPRQNGSETVLGLVTSSAGIATLLGSLIATFAKEPKSRVRVIYLSTLFSLVVENLVLTFARTPYLWCFAQVLGWLPVPLLNANLDVIMRTEIPTDMQGRVFACRNTLQFFTIPLGYYLGGFMVDTLCEPLMASLPSSSLLVSILGMEKGSGAALMTFFLAISGLTLCLGFWHRLKKFA